MDYGVKLETLRKELECSIKFFTLKHSRTKRRAQAMKISSVSFSALITVILGITINENMTEVFRNVALILGACVTIINAVDAYFNYNALWIKSTVTLAKLQELRRKVDFYSAGASQEQIYSTKIDEFLEEFQQILKEDIKQWLRIREKVNSMDQNKEQTEFIDLKLRSRASIDEIIQDPNKNIKS